MQEEHVICHESRNLKEHEKNYATHDLELAVIVHALKMWRHYLLGCKFELRTNHMSLKYFLNQPSLITRKSRWLKFLSEFDSEIKHVKGKENKVVDALSIKFHLAAMSICKAGLGEHVIKASTEDEKYLQVVARLKKKS